MTSRPFASLVAGLIWLGLVALWSAWTALVLVAWLIAVFGGKRRDYRKVAKGFVRFPSVCRIAAWLPGRRRQPYRPVAYVPRRERVRLSKGERATVVRTLRLRDGDGCRLCGTVIDFTLPQTDPWAEEIDHIVPFSLGGPCALSNFQLAHAWCNRRKGATLVRQEVAA